MAGYGRYQLHFMYNGVKIGDGPQRDLPRVGEHIIMNAQIANDPQYENVEMVIEKVTWHLKNPTTLVVYNVKPV